MILDFAVLPVVAPCSFLARTPPAPETQNKRGGGAEPVRVTPAIYGEYFFSTLGGVLCGVENHRPAPDEILSWLESVTISQHAISHSPRLSTNTACRFNGAAAAMRGPWPATEQARRQEGEGAKSPTRRRTRGRAGAKRRTRA